MNYYEILGVSPRSESEVIDAAYRAMMKKYHPDTFAGDSAEAGRKAKLLNEAYATLRDKNKRSVYDQAKTVSSENQTTRSQPPRSSSASDGATAQSPPFAQKPKARKKGLHNSHIHLVTVAGGALIATFILMLMIGGGDQGKGAGAPSENDPTALAEPVASSSDTPLTLMFIIQDHQTLASGNELLALSGRVINLTDLTQSVPALRADLHDDEGKLVYSWTIAPPAERLGPRSSANFKVAELVPANNATSLTLRWAS